MDRQAIAKRLVASYEASQMLSWLKGKRVDVLESKEDRDGLWLKFGNVQEAKKTAGVLGQGGWDVNEHQFARETLFVKWKD
jgi:hypothetical protein